MGDQQKKRKNVCIVPETERWILCDSKSNPGHKYYYNPLTKQSFWHNTDEEIKRKEKRIPNVISQPNSTKIDKQPCLQKRLEEASTTEPKIINIMHPSNPMNIWDIPFVQPTVPLIQQTLPTAFINSPFLCNQIINPSTQTALVNLQSGTINQTHNIDTFSSNVDINSYQSTNPVERQESNYTVNCNTDLRNKIKKKRFKQHRTLKNNINVNEETDVNVSWDAQTVKDILSYFRGFAAPHARPDRWYIVPDTLVVTNHSRLLYQMTEGNRCRLKIPPFVRIELKNLEKETANEAISRFLRYHCAEKDTDITPPNDLGTFYNIVNTCQNLADDNYHVVLLCYTDKKFISYKKALNVPVFTVNKIKELHSRGRIRPRNSILLPETVPIQSFSNDTKNKKEWVSEDNSTLDTENKDCQSTLKIVQENKPEISLDSISTKSEVGKIDEIHEKLDTAIVEHNICLSNPDATSLSNNYLCSNKSTKKRIIKLKPASEEIHTGAHLPKKKRWNAVRNINQKSSFVTLQSIPNYKATGDLSENVHDAVFPVAKTEDIDNPIVQSHKEQNDDCDVLTSSKPIVAIAAKASISNIDSKKNNSDSTSHILTDCMSKTIEESGFENFSTQGNRWIEKFDQIMKDVLMGVLGQDKTVDGKESVQLQHLYKAILDVIRNFSHCWLIVDAANKLSMKITQARDSKGAIKFDQKFFDDMYIYGVNLVEALQEISSNVEDIKNAKGLLENIRDDTPIFNGDRCHSNSTDVADQSPDFLKNNCVKYNEEHNIIIDTKKSNIECTIADEITSGNVSDYYNRNSKKRKLDEINNQENIYFTALKLRKRDNEHLVEDVHNSSIIESDEHKHVQLNSDMEKNENNLLVDIQSTEYLAKDNMGDKDEQQVSNLEKNGNSSLVDMVSTEYLSEDTAVGINGRSEIENDKQINNVYKTASSKILELNLESKPEYENNEQYICDEDESSDILITNNLGNEKFKYFIGMFVKEIREALMVCAQNFEMCVTHQNAVNNDLSDKFHEVHAHLYDTQRLLDSILHRENDDVNNNLKSSLKKAGVDKLDQNMCDEYRYIVTKCKNEVNAFLKILERKFVDQNCDVPLPSPQYV